jgi:hypothetical protein
VGAQNKTGDVDCLRTHQEIAAILTARGYPTTSKVVWHLEKQALRKITAGPQIQHLAEEMGLQVARAVSP